MKTHEITRNYYNFNMPQVLSLQSNDALHKTITQVSGILLAALNILSYAHSNPFLRSLPPDNTLARKGDAIITGRVTRCAKFTSYTTHSLQLRVLIQELQLYSVGYHYAR